MSKEKGCQDPQGLKIKSLFGKATKDLKAIGGGNAQNVRNHPDVETIRSD